MPVLLPLDVETTGLDWFNDSILEIYCQPVDQDTLEPVGEPFHAVIEQKPGALDRMSSFVRKMHEKTGLLAELEYATDEIEDVAHRLTEYLAQYPKGVLTGRNVGTFDRRFLEENGVDLSVLHYQHLDMSTVLRVLHAWPSLEGASLRMPEFEGAQHRAKDDVLHDIEMLRVIADYLEAVQ